ncbi:DUF3857 domain-containing protein [Flavobacterium sp.]|uniref:DUF3857 domain-containing protein n=1 Tax=Flavobacterium sp. TaxID=239 RepID=UPI0026202217|nr:DUF3857 domain-containing protein [Flavobacterium sp.]MDD2985002.1 DUF3857 domain-containing protein [Flavobacterium sp.]
MTKMHFFFVFLFVTFQVTAQKYELGKVTKEELAEEFHKKDTSAVAAILFKKAKTYFDYKNDGFKSFTEVEMKIKVYKPEGFKWADVEIPYYIGYEKLKDEKIEILSAFTYNLVDNAIDKQKVTKESKFDNQLNEFWSKITVSFPSVKAGSIIELKYKLKTENISILPEFQFQYEIPVNYAELLTEIPEFYLYKGFVTGFEKIASEQKMNSKVDVFQDKYNQGLKMVYKQVVTLYSIKDVKPLIEEEYVNNIDNYYGKVLHELETVRLPGEQPKQISTTWENVVKTIFEEKEFGFELIKFNYFLKDAENLVRGLTTNEQKMKAIFSYVQDRMNWNNRYGYYTKKGVEAAYKEKTGNVAEINLILTAMLRLVGFDANPVLVSTRKNGVAFFPNHSVFNYVITSVKLDGETLLLDATEKYTDINSIPLRALNWSGRSMDPNNSSEEVDLMPKKNSVKMVNVMAEINSNGEVNGKIREQFFDYFALWFRSIFGNSNSTIRMDYIEKEHSSLEVLNHEVLQNKEVAKPIIENYSFESSNEVEIIGNNMYFSPLLFFATTENPFKQENRLYPIDFVFPYQEKYNVSVKIPEGYSIETMPESKVISLPDGLGSFKFSISNNGNLIQLLCVLEINQPLINADYYQELKLFFKQMVSKQTEKVVLKKG